MIFVGRRGGVWFFPAFDIRDAIDLGSCVWKWQQLVLKSGRVSEQDGLEVIDLFGAFWMFSPEGEVGNGAGTEVFWDASVLEYYTEPLRLLLPANSQGLLASPLCLYSTCWCLLYPALWISDPCPASLILHHLASDDVPDGTRDVPSSSARPQHPFLPACFSLHR